MKILVKYWKKDKSFTVVANTSFKELLYDGRSKDFLKWLKSKTIVWTWNEGATSLEIGSKKRIKSSIVFAIFEDSKNLGLIK